jgi:hypothetical protein
LDLHEVLLNLLQGAAAVHAHVDADFLLCPKGKCGAGIAGWKAQTSRVPTSCMSSLKTPPSRHFCVVLGPSLLIYGSYHWRWLLVRWSFGALARRLPICLLQQALPDSGDGGARTAACLRLVLVFVVVARWSNDLFLFLLLLDFFVLLLMIINESGGIFAKKAFFGPT